MTVAVGKSGDTAMERSYYATAEDIESAVGTARGLRPLMLATTNDNSVEGDEKLGHMGAVNCRDGNPVTVAGDEITITGDVTTGFDFIPADLTMAEDVDTCAFAVAFLDVPTGTVTVTLPGFVPRRRD